jgi:hypothetical protein
MVSGFSDSICPELLFFCFPYFAFPGFAFFGFPIFALPSFPFSFPNVSYLLLPGEDLVLSPSNQKEQPPAWWEKEEIRRSDGPNTPRVYHTG